MKIKGTLKTSNSQPQIPDVEKESSNLISSGSENGQMCMWSTEYEKWVPILLPNGNTVNVPYDYLLTYSDKIPTWKKFNRLPDGNKGDILVNNGAYWQTLSASQSNGKFLKGNGANLPTWEDIAFDKQTMFIFVDNSLETSDSENKKYNDLKTALETEANIDTSYVKFFIIKQSETSYSIKSGLTIYENQYIYAPSITLSIQGTLTLLKNSYLNVNHLICPSIYIDGDNKKVNIDVNKWTLSAGNIRLTIKNTINSNINLIVDFDDNTRYTVDNSFIIIENVYNSVIEFFELNKDEISLIYNETFDALIDLSSIFNTDINITFDSLGLGKTIYSSDYVSSIMSNNNIDNCNIFVSGITMSGESCVYECFTSISNSVYELNNFTFNNSCDFIKSDNENNKNITMYLKNVKYSENLSNPYKSYLDLTIKNPTYYNKNNKLIIGNNEVISNIGSVTKINKIFTLDTTKREKTNLMTLPLTNGVYTFIMSINVILSSGETAIFKSEGHVIKNSETNTLVFNTLGNLFVHHTLSLLANNSIELITDNSNLILNVTGLDRKNLKWIVTVELLKLS